MEPFDFAQSFIERSTHTASTQTLAAAFQHAFSKRKMHETDPVLLHAERTLLPFFWDAPDFQARITTPQRDALAQGADLGLVRGYTIPIHLPWTPAALRASCSVVPDSRSITASIYFAVRLMAMHLYHCASRAHEPQSAASSKSVLSMREGQCLELAAQGKSNWAIGQILGISEHTVHRHIKSARRRLGVATLVQAVIRAMQGGHISVGDVILYRRTANSLPAEPSPVTISFLSCKSAQHAETIALD